MVREFSKGFYKSKTWQRCRSDYAKSVGYLCEDCLRRGIYKPDEIVQYKIELKTDNIGNTSIAFDWSNLELAYRDCHEKKPENQK